MLFLKSVIFLLVSTSVLAANTVCACGVMEDESRDAGGFESHQHHDHGPHNTDLILSCTDLNCDGCDVRIAFNERDQLKKSYDDDVAYVSPAVFSFNNTYDVNRNDKHYRDPPLAYGTPALRYDIILQ